MPVLVVADASEEGLAYRNGIRVGDIVLKVGDEFVSTNISFSRELSRYQNTIRITLYRDGEDLELEVPAGKLGLRTEEKNLDVRELRANFQAKQLADRVTVVTMDSIDGYVAESIIGIVSSEYVVGINLIKEVFVGGRDIFGGRSKVVQDAFREAKEVALSEIRKEALALGANAILGVRFQHSQMSGTGSTMLLLITSGTAAVIKQQA